MESYPNQSIINIENYYRNILNNIKIPQNIILHYVENMSINKFLNILDNLRYDGYIFIPFETLNYFFLNKETIYPLYIELYNDISVVHFKELDLIFSINIDNLCYDAAKIGCLNLLRIAYRNGYQWDEKTCEIAATNGYLDCLQYAYENECNWDKKTCEMSAANGHLDCLQYALENGCPCEEQWSLSQALLNIR